MNKLAPSTYKLDAELEAIRRQLINWIAPAEKIDIWASLAGCNEQSSRVDAQLELDTHSATIYKLLTEDPRFPGFKSLMIRSLNGGYDFYPKQAAEALIRQALKRGSGSAAIDWLQSVMSMKSATGKYVTAVWNCPVTNEIELAENLKLVPFSLLPDSIHKQSLIKRTFIGLNSSVLEFELPTSALVMAYRVDPLIVDPEIGIANDVSTSYLAAYEKVSNAILALTLLGPRAPIMAAAWHQFDDPDLNEVCPSPRYGRIKELLPQFRAESFPPIEQAEAVTLVRQFLDFSPNHMPRVSISIDRLQRALLRHQVGDKAVELSIALEALLSDKGNSEMTHKVSVRGVRYLGGLTEERTRNLLILKRTYEIRSKLVHQGLQEAGAFSIHKGAAKIQASDLLDEACKLCASILKKIIVNGEIPDWTSFDIAT